MLAHRIACIRIASPGGTYMSANLFEQVKTKLDLTIQDLGTHDAKNISEPVRVFGPALDDRAAAIVP